MKLVIALLLGSFGVFALAAPSQDEKEFEGWMKATGATVGSLRKNVEGKTNEGAAQDAEKLAGIFKSVEGFWQARKTEDAVKWSQQAQTVANEIAAAAKGGESEKAVASLKTLMSTCSACHTAHRERLPEGGYKIK
jgi:cytochrome c556